MERLDMDPFDTVYARMLFVSRRRTQAELADLLNLQQGSISEAKKRGWIPLAWCVRISDLFHVRMDWLRFGEPPIFMAEGRSENLSASLSASGLHQPPQLPLRDRPSGELPVHSMVLTGDGRFPEIGTQVFPLEFLREGVEIFRMLDHSMSPVLNAGALVAVLRKADVEDGALVAVLSDDGLQIRRVFRVENGYELRAEQDALGEHTRLVPDESWPDVYYGKAVWAFQPL